MKPIATPAELSALLVSYQRSAALMAAARLRLLEALAAGEGSAAALARRVGARDGRRLAALLDALVALGAVERAGRRYRLAEAARGLAGSGSARARHHLDHWDDWGRLAERIAGTGTARGGEGAYREDFARTMEENGRERAHRVAAAFPLPAGARLLDLGCGSGAYGAAWLRACPGAEVTFCDLPGTVRVARRLLREGGIPPARRGRGGARFLVADFLRDSLGGPYDFAWISHVLHGLGPDDCLSLLRKVRGALAPGGTVAVQEFLPGGDGSEPEGLSFFRLHMAAVTEGGRLYTARELSSLLRGAGFRAVSAGDPDGDAVGVVTGRATGTWPRRGRGAAESSPGSAAGAPPPRRPSRGAPARAVERIGGRRGHGR